MESNKNGIVPSNGINIVGIRNNLFLQPNSFDDTIVVFWKEEDQSAWEFCRYKATTDPGISYLGKGNAMNTRGTAILCEGQYRKAYALGLHHHRYEALRQVGNLTVTR